MTTRMLIDARHPEETRVAVLKGNRIEEFDFDSADHKQIKGNIYLAKVTRVEPSLQAAFVDFGGNRHGFLAFSEIHPDYYQIPKEDREALLAEEAAHAAEEAALRAAEEAEEDAYAATGGGYPDSGEDDAGHGDYARDDYAGEARADLGGVTEIDSGHAGQVATIEDGHVHGFDDAPGYHDEDGEAQDHRGLDGDDDTGDGDTGDDETGDDETGDDETGGQDGPADSPDGQQARRRGRRQGRGQAKDGNGQADDLRARRMALRRRYKIQDVIHRRQVLLVQVVKEERGNKGAALTSYLSLAGRYCVLMPNSSHGGGISRKISSAADRKRLKSIVAEMALPKSMGCIVRTAGLQRTRVEIKRDFDYLARLWDDIRDTTLHSSAPALIHSDSDLIKRAIRDIYNRDIEEVVVEGEGGYRLARDFMKLLMPSHARRVKAYIDPVPLFQRFGAEDQLTAMYDPVVQLRSGGYIVINPTEALVSIDINSGRSTKEHGIEATAVNTNLEAAREIARQLRLRDMAGLVVIDFIDMEYGSNLRKVEKAVKDALKDDRARIQVGRISGFGLMEMSRQRLRTGVLEATTRSCPHCDGTGLVRTAGSAGLSALRLIEEEAAKGRGIVITLFASQEAAIYVLNAKRANLAEIEVRYGVSVEVIPEGENEGAKMRVASSGPRNEFVPKLEAVAYLDDDDDLPEDEEEGVDEDLEDDRRRETGDHDGDGEHGGETGGGETSSERTGAEGGNGDARRKRRKRRRGRGRDGEQAGRDEPGVADDAQEDADDAALDGAESEEDGEAGDAGDEAEGRRRRRGRRRRGGRNRGEPGDAPADEAQVAGETPAAETPGEIAALAEPAQTLGESAEAQVEPAAALTGTDEVSPPKKRARRKKADDPENSAATTATGLSDIDAPAEKPRRVRRKKDEPETGVDVVAAAGEAGPAKRVRRRKDDAVAAEQTAALAADTRPTDAGPGDTGPGDTGSDETAPGDAGATGEAAPAPRPAADLVNDGPVQAAAGEDTPSAQAAGPEQEPRRGWWQRTFGS